MNFWTLLSSTQISIEQLLPEMQRDTHRALLWLKAWKAKVEIQRTSLASQKLVGIPPSKWSTFSAGLWRIASTVQSILKWTDWVWWCVQLLLYFLLEGWMPHVKNCLDLLKIYFEARLVTRNPRNLLAMTLKAHLFGFSFIWYRRRMLKASSRSLIWSVFS